MTSQGVWICIDGVEGAGKTTLTDQLDALIDVDRVSEFSEAPFGQALRAAVALNPHRISSSGTAQSLVFLGDFIELYESKVLPSLRAGRTVVTDRGYLSKHAYQCVILTQDIGMARAASLLGEVLSLVQPPDLTVYLSCPLDVIEHRLLVRDGHCDEQRSSFISRADQAARDRLEAGAPHLPHIVLDTTQPPEAVASAAALAAAGLGRSG